MSQSPVVIEPAHMVWREAAIMDGSIMRFASWTVLVVLFVCGWPPQVVAQKTAGFDATVVKTGELVPPRVAPPCQPGRCPFVGQSVTVLLFTGRAISEPA